MAVGLFAGMGGYASAFLSTDKAVCQYQCSFPQYFPPACADRKRPYTCWAWKRLVRECVLQGADEVCPLNCSVPE